MTMCFSIISLNFPLPALTAQGYYQYQAAQDPAQYYAQYYAQADQSQQFAAAQDQGWVTSE